MHEHAWIAKSLLIGLVAGLVSFALGYGFLTVHQELGLNPGFSYKPAILAFILALIVSAIYLNLKARNPKI